MEDVLVCFAVLICPVLQPIRLQTHTCLIRTDVSGSVLQEVVFQLYYDVPWRSLFRLLRFGQHVQRNRLDSLIWLNWFFGIYLLEVSMDKMVDQFFLLHLHLLEPLESEDI